MKVIIAEKPSVARDIAAIIGANKRKDGYIEGNGYAVTWAFGHLVGLALPEHYGITGFRAENLPILPPKFILMPRQVKEGKKHKTDPGVMKQLKIIKRLFDKCERIVVANDAGREGELIFRFIYNYLNCTKPFERLWISSLTNQAIRKGFENLRLGNEYDNLYHSAKARNQADWLIGINASQALSISAGQGVWSLGRVQTPTLAMVCSRYLENKDFKPQTYYQLKLSTKKGSVSFAAVSNYKYNSKQDADTTFERIRSAKFVSVANVETKQANQEPPLLYDLTSLQKEANSRHGFSADKTLSVAQSLYEAGLISYPRTGSRYISADVFNEIPELLKNLSTHATFGTYAEELSGKELNKQSVNDDKVSDHHALIVTENIPTDISDDQRIVYDMIAGRMLEAFSDKCLKENTTALLDVSGITFTAKGSLILVPGWKLVFNRSDESNNLLPALSTGEILPVKEIELLEKQTKARPLHTESSLLAAMETCGKELTTEDEREALKEAGIGTPATRAAIIETLFTREYIERKKKSLVPTNKGLVVYLAVKDKRIAYVAMTGQWESALNKIASGEMDAGTFHKGIEIYTAQITKELLSGKIEGTSSRETYPCPKCKNGQVTIYRKVARCNNEGCGLRVFLRIAGKDLTNLQLKDLLTRGKTELIKGFKSKNQKSFNAAIAFNSEYETVFLFSSKIGKKKRKR